VNSAREQDINLIINNSNILIIKKLIQSNELERYGYNGYNAGIIREYDIRMNEIDAYAIY